MHKIIKDFYMGVVKNEILEINKPINIKKLFSIFPIYIQKDGGFYNGLCVQYNENSKMIIIYLEKIIMYSWGKPIHEFKYNFLRILFHEIIHYILDHTMALVNTNKNIEIECEQFLNKYFDPIIKEMVLLDIDKQKRGYGYDQ